ncbi:MAG TPA: SGNH hydrolase domain-containing protein [Solirubrobacteraceae bacterium]|nr:SGNH hydrolase domain-containing protein [Solirubrobacteraceae bacterium]
MKLREALLLVICIAITIPSGETGVGSASAEVVAAVTERPCFGAAARNPGQPCFDSDLTRTVFPTPDDALLEPNAPCTPYGRANLLFPCHFGATRATTNDTVALIGDSHATHWRAAVDVVAKSHNWPAISITRSGCPFSEAQVILPRDQTRNCQRWNRELLAWLNRRPDVSTIFLSHRSKAQFVRKRGLTNFETAVRGHMARWRELPDTVRNIYVIRDTPRSSAAAVDCVRRTLARKQPSAVLCARARGRSLRRDPAVTAARRLASPRVKVLDMTRYFCDSAHCYPVVGGALVHKDATHLTAIFARTLGRFMLRMVDELGQRPALSVLDTLLADERVMAECLLSERDLALQAGGWDKIAPEHLVRAQGCRTQLEQRAAQLKATGLTGTFNRANRYKAIQQVLNDVA